MFSGSTDDLFNVFTQKQDKHVILPTSAKDASDDKKRKPETHHHKEQHVTNQLKRARQATAIVTDAFETSSMREVKAVPMLLGPDTTTTEIRHEVALPPEYNYVPISKHVSTKPPARVYPFKLDPFQAVSTACIERGESVLVSAHTSAGKTVVAEYAIATSLRDKQRVIYTSPIKALSNQKFRELTKEFGDVGLMTGDVTINPSASCLVMTTEILRSMLYRGSEVMREVAWVVFDEIHYMRDKERGVVWEEALILLPHQVRYVFLSATIPNAMEFAEWICKIHTQPCHVVYTDFRPTPLQHYLFPAGGEGIYLVVDEKSKFREDNFQKALAYMAERQKQQEAEVDAGGSGRGKKGRNKKDKSTDGPSDVFKIVKLIMQRSYHPVIVFSFSKRECESNALQMSKLEFNDETEQMLVGEIFENAISSLSDDDKGLPQIEHILPLLKRGIGIHHSGLLPILKEVIEILFQEGLIKVLFATETFSIGLNMPAKTVVFTDVRKFDGKELRLITSGEYIQMSGRAGRRGLDDRGIVIMMVDEKLEPAAAKDMVKGDADRLNSAFHLSYNMILNLMRVDGMAPEMILEKCFKQFQNHGELPKLDQEIRTMETERNAIHIDQEDAVNEYFTLKQQLTTFQKDYYNTINHPDHILPYVQPGRLVQIQHGGFDFGWGAVVNYQKRSTPKNNKEANPYPPHEQYIVDMCLWCKSGSSRDVFVPCKEGEQGEMMVVPVMLSAFHATSSIRIYIPKDLKHKDPRQLVRKAILETKKRFPDDIPLVDPVDHQGIRDDTFKKLIKAWTCTIS